MFLTRFTRTNGELENYMYNTLDEAKNHLMLFVQDDSELYKNISVLDSKNNVFFILPFEDGKPMNVIHVGTPVKLRKEYATQEEFKRSHTYVVTNINELMERVDIACMTANMYLKPIETVPLRSVCVIPEIINHEE